MDEQASLFDRERSELEAQVGMNQASQAERVRLWKMFAASWFDNLSRGDRVTSDDLIRLIGLPDSGPNRNNVIGAIFGAAARTGKIRFTGEMRKSERIARHVGLQRVWERL
jgi:hypothetical protein